MYMKFQHKRWNIIYVQVTSKWIHIQNEVKWKENPSHIGWSHEENPIHIKKIQVTWKKIIGWLPPMTSLIIKCSYCNMWWHWHGIGWCAWTCGVLSNIVRLHWWLERCVMCHIPKFLWSRWNLCAMSRCMASCEEHWLRLIWWRRWSITICYNRATSWR